MPSLILCPAVQVAEKERSEVDNEALALSLSTTNAYFLAVLVLATFFVLRNSSPVLNYAGSTLQSCAYLRMSFRSELRYRKPATREGAEWWWACGHMAI